MRTAKTTIVNSINTKKLELEQMITGLLSRKELLDNEVGKQLESLESIQTRRDNLSREIEEFDNTLNSVHLSITQLQEYYVNLTKQIEHSLIGFSTYLLEVDKHLNQQEQKVAELKDEYKKVHDKTVLELEQLAINKSDLDIYRTRLEKKCAELYPGIKIIL